jgi:hypothetical protein
MLERHPFSGPVHSAGELLQENLIALSKSLSHAVAYDSVSEITNVGLNSPRSPEWPRIIESASHIRFPNRLSNSVNYVVMRRFQRQPRIIPGKAPFVKRSDGFTARPLTT